MLNIAYNALCGGRRLQDIEARRQDAVFLDGLGTESLPDPLVMSLNTTTEPRLPSRVIGEEL